MMVSSSSSYRAIPKPHDIAAQAAELPPGQRRVVEAWIGTEPAPTYGAVAAALGLHVGSVYQHLRSVRLRHPALYAGLRQVRAAGLAERHRRAHARARWHTHRWYQARADRRPVPDLSHWGRILRQRGLLG